MSKKKHKTPFDVPSKISEKYAQTLARADSADTVSPSFLKDQDGECDSTDTPLRDDVVISKPTKEGLLETFKKAGKFILVILGWLGGLSVIIAICLFFSGLNNSVDLTKTGLGRVETEVKDLAKESRAQDQDIRISLAKILEKFDRLFDNLQRTKK